MNKDVEKYTLLYKNIKKIYCSYFNKDISFNSRGLIHLKFSGQGRARSNKEKIIRMKLLKYVKEILEKSHTLQGVLKEEKLENIRKENKNEIKKVAVSYYEFIAVVDNKRIKIILKQINNGNIFFYSIIPYWKNLKNGRKNNSINKTD